MKVFGLGWLFMLVGTLIQISACPANPGQSALPSINEVLWWMPGDTEMVAVLQNLPERGTGDGDTPDFLSSIAEVGTFGIRGGKFDEQLQSLKINQIISGSRKFRTTRGFGLLPYEGCTAIILESPLPKNHALKQWLTKSSERTKSIAGNTAYIFSEKLGEDRWYFLVTQPHPNLVLCATNARFLDSVLRRRMRSEKERRKTIRALPATLAEWKYVDTKADEWALRHYRRDQALLDPTSPLSGKNRMANIPDTSAIGLTYSSDKKRNIAKIRYLTAPRKAAHMAKVHRDFWEGLISGMGGVSEQSQKWRPQINERSGGLVEMEFSFPKSIRHDTTGMFSFGLLALMGHAIIV